MNQNSVSSDTTASDKESFCVGTDLTDLVELFRSMAQDTQKEIAELNKLQRSMYDGIIQKQNSELEEYRRGAIQQSLISVLRSMALIYNENCQEFETGRSQEELLSSGGYLLSQIRELLEDNDVHVHQSAPGDEFDRKMMRTEGRYVVPTASPEQERKVAESIKPGFVFCGVPVLQELVSLYKYDPELAAEEQKPVMSDGNRLVMGDIPVAELAPIEETDALKEESTRTELLTEEAAGSGDASEESEKVTGSGNAPNESDKKMEREESNYV